MDDTSPEIYEKLKELYADLSPEARLQMGSSMRDSSKRLMTYGILREHPHYSSQEVKKEIFYQFYKDDFDQKEMDKILEYLDEKF